MVDSVLEWIWNGFLTLISGTILTVLRIVNIVFVSTVMFFINILRSILKSLMQYLVEIVIGNNSDLSLSYFLNHWLKLPGGNLAEHSILNLMILIGLSIAFILFIYHIFFLMMGDIAQTKDTIVQLIVRLFVCCAIIYTSKYFLVGIYDYGDHLLQAVTQSYESWGASVLGGDVEIIEYDSELEILSTSGTAEDILRFFLNTVPIGLLVDIVLQLVLVYSFIKMIGELYQTWACQVSLYLFAPVAGGTLATSGTAKIFWSYISMIMGQTILLVFTRLWLYVFIVLYANEVQFAGNMNGYAGNTDQIRAIIGDLCLIAFLRIGTQIDTFMRQAGCGIAQTSGSLMDTISVTYMGMTRLATGVTRNTGTALVGAGAINGNVAAVQLGELLRGKDASSASALNTMSAVNELKGLTGINSGGGPGGNISPEIMSALADNYKAGKFNGVQNYMSSLPVGERSEAAKQLVQKLAGEGMMANHPDLADAIASGSSFKMDERGNFYGKVDMGEGIGECSFSMGAGEGPLGSVNFGDANGSDWHANFAPAQGNEFFSSDSGIDFNTENENGDSASLEKFCAATGIDYDAMDNSLKNAGIDTENGDKFNVRFNSDTGMIDVSTLDGNGVKNFENSDNVAFSIDPVSHGANILSNADDGFIKEMRNSGAGNNISDDFFRTNKNGDISGGGDAFNGSPNSISMTINNKGKSPVITAVNADGDVYRITPAAGLANPNKLLKNSQIITDKSGNHWIAKKKNKNTKNK